MKPQILKLLEKCIENGVSLGYSRAHKHNDAPTEQAVTREITKAIEYELYEWFEFDDGHREDLFVRLLRADDGLKNGDPLKDFMYEEDVEESIRLLAEIVRLSGGTKLGPTCGLPVSGIPGPARGV